MRRLLDSGENVNAYTPETSRSAVVPENTSWEVQQARVVQEMTDPSVRRVSVSRMRNDNKEEQRGKLLLGRTSLAFVLRGDESLVFSHSYLCIASYAIEKDELIYGLSAKGDLRTYRFFLDEPLTAHEIDLRVSGNRSILDFAETVSHFVPFQDGRRDCCRQCKRWRQKRRENEKSQRQRLCGESRPRKCDSGGRFESGRNCGETTHYQGLFFVFSFVIQLCLFATVAGVR